MNFWNAILESNTFNFAILLLIFAIFYKKLNVSSVIENLKSEIVKRIENAKQERLLANQKLQNAQKSVENLDDEIKAQLSDATQKAENLSNEIIATANKKATQISSNTKKIIEGEEKTLSAKLNDKVLKASIELAKEKIIKELETNPKLHENFITESIGEI